MRPRIIGLFAAILAVAFFPAVSAFAADAKADAKAAPVDPAAKAKGMQAAPAIITASGMDCQLANARLIGESTDPKTKAKSTFYEIACKGSEGFIVSTHAAPTPSDFFTCLEVEASTGAGVKCVLPENADPAAGLGPVVTKINPGCQVAKARGIGHAPDGSLTAFEVSCQDGSGYILETSYPVNATKPAKLNPCMAYPPTSNVKCTLTDEAAQNAFVDKLAVTSGKDCAVKDRRFVGATTAGDLLYEVACQNGKGYILDQASNGTLSRTIDCASEEICTLTDSRAAQTAQAGLYSKLAHNAGFACDVTKYAAFPTEMPRHEVVELACSNRPDGAVGIFGATDADKSTVYDCAHASVLSYRCSFTPLAAAYPSLTADLKTLGKSECVVSNSRLVGQGADKHLFLEVGCSDGLPGYVIEYAPEPLTPKAVVPCASGGGVAGGCTLPGNSKKS